MQDEIILRKVIEGVKYNALICLDLRGLRLTSVGLGELLDSLENNGSIISLIVDDSVLNDAQTNQVVGAILSRLMQLEMFVFLGLAPSSIIQQYLNLRFQHGIKAVEVCIGDPRRFPQRNQSTYFDLRLSKLQLLFGDNSGPGSRSRSVSSAGLESLGAAAAIDEIRKRAEMQKKLDETLRANQRLEVENSKLKNLFNDQKDNNQQLNQRIKELEAMLTVKEGENKALLSELEESESLCKEFRPSLDDMMKQASQIFRSCHQPPMASVSIASEEGFFLNRRARNRPVKQDYRGSALKVRKTQTD